MHATLQERVRNGIMEEKMRQMEAELEVIPILKAQVDVSREFMTTSFGFGNMPM